VTTQARLKLYEYLSKFGQSVLYCNIDSVIFVQKDNDPPKLKIMDQLSDLTDEMYEYGSVSFIEQFVSGGTEKYAFAVFCPSTGKRATKCEVKCITLNCENSKFVNFTTMRYYSGRRPAGACTQSPEDQTETCWWSGFRAGDKIVQCCL